MFTFKITLQPRPNAEGLYPIRLRITKERVHTYYLTGFSVRQKDWNPKGKADPWPGNWLRTSHYSHKEVNEALYALIERARLVALAEPDLSRNELRNRLQGKNDSADFLAYFEAETVKQEARQPRTGKRWRSVLNHLKRMRPVLTFAEVTHKLLREYMEFRAPSKPASSTIERDQSVILTVFRQAVKDGVTECPTPEPVKIKVTKGKKAALTAEELLDFMNVELPELIKGKPSPMRLARITYLIQFYLHGARIGDVLLLKKENVNKGRVTFDMQKTDHAKSIEIVPQLAELLRPYLRNEPYLLPWLKQEYKERERLIKLEIITKSINENLKKIAALAKIEKKLTTHTARHSFASIAISKLSDIRTVQKLLGHKNIKTTEIYLRELTTAEIDQATASIYA